MQEYFSLTQTERKKIIKKVADILSKRDGIMFAFIYGSFLDSPSFRDIDIGIYITPIAKGQIFDLEISLAKTISKAIKIPLDIIEIKVLNFAPDSFLNNIFSRGRLLISKDDKLLSDLIENTSLEAVENEYLANQSLKELIPV